MWNIGRKGFEELYEGVREGIPSSMPNFEDV